MAATTVKSTQITNIEANPIVVDDRKTEGARSPYVRIGEIEAATTSLDEANDTILMVPIPSHAIVTNIQALNDDLDSNCTPTLTLDCGLYYSGKDGDQRKDGNTSGTVIDQDNYTPTASTIFQGANTTWANLFQAPSDVKDINTEAWSSAGLTADPGGTLYVGLRVVGTAATAAAGGIVLKVEYLA